MPGVTINPKLQDTNRFQITSTKDQTMRQLGTSGSNGRCLTACGSGTSHLLERWILAQLSRRETVRLKTRLPSEESSESTQK